MFAVRLWDAAITIAVVRDAWHLIAVQIGFAQCTMRIAVEFLGILIFQTCTLFLLGHVLVVASSAGNPGFDYWASHALEVRHVFVLVVVVLLRFFIDLGFFLFFNEPSEAFLALKRILFLLGCLSFKGSPLSFSLLHLKLQSFAFLLHFFLLPLQLLF